MPTTAGVSSGSVPLVMRLYRLRMCGRKHRLPFANGAEWCYSEPRDCLQRPRQEEITTNSHSDINGKRNVSRPPAAVE